MLHHPKDLSSLTPTEQTHLAHVLALPPHHLTTSGQPSPTWLATEAHQIFTTLPTALHAPQSFLGRLLAGTTTHQRAVLCPAHSGLNSRLIRSVFLLLTAQVGRKAVRPLRRFVRHPGRYHTKREDEELVRGLVDRLAGIAALWLEPGEFARTNPGLWTRHVWMQGGCEACILAVVGGDEGVLRDLWAVLVGQTHKRRAAPAFKGMIDEWIGNLSEGQRVKREFEMLGSVVKRVRRAVWRHRHKKRGSRSVTSSKSRSGREMAMDSGYGSIAGSGGDSASRVRFEDRYAEMHEHASSLSSCGLRRGGCDDDERFIQTAVEYDVFLRKRKTPLSQQLGTLDASTTTSATYQHSITEFDEEEEEEGEEEEHDVYCFQRRPAPRQYQHPDALDANSNSSGSSNTLHTYQPFAAEENEYSIDDNDEEVDEMQRGAWSSTHANAQCAELHSALHARDSLAKVLIGRGEGRNSIGAMICAKPLALSLADDVSESGETYDSTQWTDVSVATWKWRRERGQVVGCCGSSSVYSTADTAEPHPPASAASTVVGELPLRRVLASNEELAFPIWPNPFRKSMPAIITTATSSGKANGSQTSSCTKPSSQTEVTATVGGSTISTFLSSDEFQKALERLSLVDSPDAETGGMLGISDGTILPGESISAVGRCACMTRVDL
ncbi:hypothetical protein N0V93_004695 [Gnomoniopsis smithogilvyi]|uniref:Uncharacterized protein n=1 Tax=Gnomoniopsis smithogilvyi TaxID=1191159 RepID=A0A9W8YT26_9PEZI|nr:hypothetical protein N0V93_004695 [Gnomoniopsis smithogilvyi]